MKKKVLIIESSNAIRFLLQTVLEKDFEVFTAADGASAIYWLSRKILPSLIITDPELPDLEDWELIEQLSTSPIYNRIPIIVLSSLSQSETAQKSAEYNLARFFNKPFNPIALMEAAKSVVYEDKRELNLAR